jgi:hypothetical protein
MLNNAGNRGQETKWKGGMKTNSPFGGWSHRQQKPPALLHTLAGRAATSFNRMRHFYASSLPPPETSPYRVRDVGFDRPPKHRRSVLSLLRSRRHGRDRILRYIILPLIIIVTTVGIFLLLRN